MNRWACVWTEDARGTCDGCSRGGGVAVMRADGVGGVSLCERCHRQYMRIWRREDAVRERSESCDGLAAA